MAVAQNILDQLGGCRFIAMTGARNFVLGKCTLTFSLPGNLTKNRVNKVHIVLGACDFYRVETYRVRGINCTLIDVRHGVCCDNLQEVFTNLTGLDTSF